MNICCHTVQRCSAFVRICQGQGQRCSGDFLLSGDVLLGNGELGGSIFHYDLVVVLGQSVYRSDLAVSSDLEVHLLGLFGEAVRCGGFFQRVHACRQIFQCHTALGVIRSPCNGVAAGFDSSSAAVTVGALDLAQVCSCRCSQFQYGSGEFFSAADCLLADRHAGLLTVLHGNVVAGNVIFCGSRCINYTVFNGKGEVCAYLVIAVRCNYLRHGVGAVRQTDDVGLVFAVRNKGDSIRCLCVFAVIGVVLQRVCLCQQSFPTLDLQHICIQTAVCPSDLDSCTCQFLRSCNILLVHTDLCTVDNRYTGASQLSICHRFCIFCDNIAVIADFKCNFYRHIVILCSFCQFVLSGCQISKYFCCTIGCPAFLITIRLFQSQLIAGHCLTVYICFCKGQFHLCGIGISNGLFARNTRQQVYPTAVAGVGSEECLAAY